MLLTNRHFPTPYAIKRNVVVRSNINNMGSVYHITSSKGNKLYCEEYKPTSAPSAILLWHHGLGDYEGRYAQYFLKLAEAGIAVHAYDAYGHGKSEYVVQGLVEDFNILIDDFIIHHDYVIKKYDTKLPMFLGGQSMGGLVTTHVAIKKPDLWTGLVLTSAAIDVPWTTVLRVQAALGNILANVIPKAQIVPAVNPSDMSQDPEVVKEFINDPLIQKGNTRARTANEILKAMRSLYGKEKDLKLPILALHGTVDKTTSSEAVKNLLAKSDSTDKTFKPVEGGYHELLMGPEKAEVISTISDWIKAHSQGAKL